MTAYQKDLFTKINELTPKERYILCCKIIGKNKTDEILKDLAKHPLKRLWWKRIRLWWRIKRLWWEIKRRFQRW